MDSSQLPYPAPVRRAAMLVAAALALVIGYYSLVPPGEAPAPQLSDKVRHFAAYAALAVPAAMWLAPRRVLPAIGAATYGIALEIGQAFAGTGREGSIGDVLANGLGASAGVFLVWLIARRRR